MTVSALESVLADLSNKLINKTVSGKFWGIQSQSIEAESTKTGTSSSNSLSSQREIEVLQTGHVLVHRLLKKKIEEHTRLLSVLLNTVIFILITSIFFVLIFNNLLFT